MKDKGHFYISLAKSLLRMGACIYCIIFAQDLVVKVFAAIFLGAEVLGVGEEIFDKR